MTKDMTSGKITPLLINFTIPLVLGNLFQLTYNAADSIIVGKFVGEDALAAVGTANPLMTLAILFIKSDLRLVIDLQTCVKAQQSRAYAQKVKISNLQQMARTVAYVQKHGYDSYEKLSETAEAIYTKMAKARGDAKLTESKLRKTNEQIHYLGQYLSTKSIYGEFLKAPNKKIFRQAHSDELAQYEEALQILKQHSPDGKFPTMKDLRAEKEQLTIQKDAQYDTYRYFKDYHKELQTVCANVDSILGAEQKVQQHEQQHTRKYEPSL